MSICDNLCGDGALPSSPNDIKILLIKLKKEVDQLVKSTETKLLCQDGQIAQACQYLKNNLSNSIRCLLADMEASRRIRQNYYRCDIG